MWANAALNLSRFLAPATPLGSEPQSSDPGAILVLEPPINHVQPTVPQIGSFLGGNLCINSASQEIH